MDKMATGIGNGTSNDNTWNALEGEIQSGVGPATTNINNSEKEEVRADPHFDREQVNSSSECSKSQTTSCLTPSECKSAESGEITSFTCFIEPCPELENAYYKHFEFILCRLNPDSNGENNKMKYDCCPLSLVTMKNEGKKVYSLEPPPKIQWQ